VDSAVLRCCSSFPLSSTLENPHIALYACCFSYYGHVQTCYLSPCVAGQSWVKHSVKASLNQSNLVPTAAGKIKDFIKFDLGNLAMVTGGHNNGRVGTIVHKERHRCGDSSLITQ
jgi:hypothetical protein